MPRLVAKCQPHLASAAATEPQQNEPTIHRTVALDAAWKDGIHTDDAAHSRGKEAEDGL